MNGNYLFLYATAGEMFLHLLLCVCMVWIIFVGKIVGYTGGMFVELTKTDKAILNSYNKMLDGLSMYLGEGYEIVLHSLEDYGSSAVKVLHGDHTGRSAGAPLTDLALDYLERMEKKPDDEEKKGIAYFTRNRKGEPLRSVTIPVKGENDRVIGLVCINFNLNTSLLQYINNFVDNEEHLQGNWEDREEKFSLSGPELVESMTEQIRDEVMEDMRIASVNKNKEIIQRLEEKGIFKVKESVAKVSEILGISKNTDYLHLRNLEVEK